MTNNSDLPEFPHHEDVAHTVLARNVKYGESVTIHDFQLTLCPTGLWAIADGETGDPVTFLDPRGYRATIELLNWLAELRTIVDNTNDPYWKPRSEVKRN